MPHNHALKRVFLHRNLLQTGENHIALRDQTDQRTLFQDRHMAKPVFCHQRQNIIRACLRVAGHNVGRHKLFDWRR